MFSKFRFGNWMQVVSLVVIFLLVTTTAFLFRSNRQFQQQNRRLIIENDSIIAENIELTRTLKEGQQERNHQSSTSFKVRK